MNRFSDLAIVLRSVPYGERHQIVTALTQNYGKLSGIALNSVHSRRFGSGLDLFSASEWSMTEKAGNDRMLRIDEISQKRAYPGIKKSLGHLAIASALNEILLRAAPERTPCPDLFKLHSNALAEIDEATEFKPMVLINLFFFRVLRWCGNSPKIEACLSCKKAVGELSLSEEVYPNPRDAGWICPQCTPQKPSSISALAVWDLVSSANQPIRAALLESQASETAHSKIFGFLQSFAADHLPGFDREPIKSLRFFSEKPADLTS